MGIYFNQILNITDQQPALLTDRSLYGQVLGERVAAVHPQVAALHCSTKDVTAQGWLRVTRGSGWLCRLVGLLARLPRAGSEVWTWLTISPGREGERWVRQIGDGPTTRSWQSVDGGSQLVERFGLLTFVFILETVGGGLRYRQRACRLQLAGLTLPVPDALAPRVAAEVRPAPTGGVTVDVRVECAAGLLLAYTGTVTVGLAKP